MVGRPEGGEGRCPQEREPKGEVDTRLPGTEPPGEEGAPEEQTHTEQGTGPEETDSRGN